jgi:hypothetical protein
MRFQVLTLASMKMAVFWDVATCNLVEIDRRFRDAYCLHYQGAGIAVSTSETCMYFYQTTGRNIPEDSYIHFNSYLSLIYLLQFVFFFFQLGEFVESRYNYRTYC